LRRMPPEVVTTLGIAMSGQKLARRQLLRQQNQEKLEKT